MPVYGLPLSLEASLNSLVELRPPTSWRVSGHGDEVTVVLRWTLSGSPSSDKTLDYDIDQGARSSGQVDTSSLWTRGIKRTEKLSPGIEIKTRSSSVHDCRLTSSHMCKYDCLQPFKLRKLDTSCPHPPSPVPVYLSVADGTFPSPSPETHIKPHQLVCESTNIQPRLLVCESTHTQPHLIVCESTHTQPHPIVCESTNTQPHPIVCESTHTQPHPIVCESTQTQPRALVCESTHPHAPVCENVHTKHGNTEILFARNRRPTSCDSQRASAADTQMEHLTPQNPTGETDTHEVAGTYVIPWSSHVSPETTSTTLDERSGLFTNAQHLIHPHKVDGKKAHRPSLADPMQNDSGCASESNSTSLSHYVKHTLSHDSSSQDGSLYKSASSSGSNGRSPSADNTCSSADSSASRSSFALQSCSSKNKMESVNSSNGNTNLMDEKDDDCRSQDLDMVCSNEAGQEESEHEEGPAGSVSSRSSISYWDSFDSFQSDLLAPQVDGSEETRISNDCVSQNKSPHLTV